MGLLSGLWGAASRPGSEAEPPVCSSAASSEEPWPPVPLARLRLLRGSLSVTTVTSLPGSFRRTLAEGESSDSPLRTSPSADCRLRGERELELTGIGPRASMCVVSSLAEYIWWSTGQLDSNGETSVMDLSFVPVFSSFSFSLLATFSSLLAPFSSSLATFSFSSLATFSLLACFSLLQGSSLSVVTCSSGLSSLPLGSGAAER